jgi:hypothetical protein
MAQHLAREIAEHGTGGSLATGVDDNDNNGEPK